LSEERCWVSRRGPLGQTNGFGGEVARNSLNIFGSREIPAFGFRRTAIFFGRDALPRVRVFGRDAVSFLFPAIVPLWHDYGGQAGAYRLKKTITQD